MNSNSVCRICLLSLPIDYITSIHDNVNVENEIVEDKISTLLYTFVPEMNLNVSKDPVICKCCLDDIKSLYKFRKKCLLTEERIAGYASVCLSGGTDFRDLFEVAKTFKLGNVPIEVPVISEVCIKAEPVDVKEELHEVEGNNQNETEIRIKIEDTSQEVPNKNESIKQRPKSNPSYTKKRRGNRSKPSICEVCSKTLPSVKCLVKHFIAAHPGHHAFNCEYCGKGFNRQSAFLEHRKRLHISANVKPHTCAECHRSFRYKSKLVKHMTQHQGEKSHVCDICNKAFYFVEGLRVHRQTHDGQRPFKCQLCNKDFARKTMLNHHLRVHDNIKAYSCPSCDKKYFTNGKMQEHIKLVHSDVPPKICEFCGKGYATNSHLKVHLRVHTGERNFKCDVCRKSFYEDVHLALHMRGHTGERPYECTICSKRFTQPNCVKEHMKTHDLDRVRDRKCDLCEMSFYDETRLKVHRKTHFRIATYNCEVCGSELATKSYLKIHMRKYHIEKSEVANKTNERGIENKLDVEADSLIKMVDTKSETIDVEGS